MSLSVEAVMHEGLGDRKPLCALEMSSLALCPPALLLLYDVTNKASFDNIQVSGFLPGGRAEAEDPGDSGESWPPWWLRVPVG